MVEQYLPHAPRCRRGAVHPRASRRRSRDHRAGAPVSLACSILVPDDDLCLHVLTAASAKAAVQTAELAGITPERTVDATAWWSPDRPDQ